MKKLLVLSVVTLLALTGCASNSGSKSTPEDAFKNAVAAQAKGQSVNFTVASVIKTEDGDIPFDNFGKIVVNESENFDGMVSVKAEVEGNYEDLVIYVNKGKFYLELNDAKTVLTKDELLALGVVDFTLINTLVTDYDEVTSNEGVHTYTKESTDIEAVKAFSTYSHLSTMKVKEGSLTQTVVVENDMLVSNTIYIIATYVATDGTEYPVTQSIELKYSADIKYDLPEFSEFK